MTEERSKILDKAKKLKELADRGIGGEQTNAKDMLDKYMKKHNITMAEIENHDYSDKSMFNGMSDNDFLNEILKDLLVVGIGLLISSFFGKAMVSDFKDKSIGMLSKKYKSELHRRAKK